MEELRLSPTSLNMFLRCQYQWYLRYIEGLKVPPSAALVLGLSFHKGEEHNFTQKIDTLEDVPLDEVLDVYDFEFETLSETVEKWEEDKGKLKDSGYLLLKKYHTEVAPLVQPKAVEDWVEREFNGVTLYGKRDILTIDNKVIDLKTIKRKPSKIDLSYQMQLELYSFAGNTKKAAIHYAVKTKKPEIIVIEYNLPKEQRLLKVVSSVTDAIKEALKTGNFIPNGLGHSWACQYCGYREQGLCPYHK